MSRCLFQKFRRCMVCAAGASTEMDEKTLAASAVGDGAASPPPPPALPAALTVRAAHHQWEQEPLHQQRGSAGGGAERCVDRLLDLPQAELGELVSAYRQQSVLPEELHAAVSGGDRDRAAQLVATVAEIECAVDWRDEHGRTAAYVAAAQNDAQSLALLVSRGADLGARDADGRTLLHSAVSSNALDCARVLIRLRADIIDAADTVTGATPLHAAAATAGLLESAHLLLSAGAPSAAPDARGRTPLHVAAAAGQACVCYKNSSNKM